MIQWEIQEHIIISKDTIFEEYESWNMSSDAETMKLNVLMWNEDAEVNEDNRMTRKKKKVVKVSHTFGVVQYGVVHLRNMVSFTFAIR